MANSQMVLTIDSTQTSNLYIAFELSNKKWKLMFSDGRKRRQRTIEAGDQNLKWTETFRCTVVMKLAGMDSGYIGTLKKLALITV